MVANSDYAGFLFDTNHVTNSTLTNVHKMFKVLLFHDIVYLEHIYILKWSDYLRPAAPFAYSAHAGTSAAYPRPKRDFHIMSHRRD
jgi:hypothetical protein